MVNTTTAGHQNPEDVVGTENGFIVFFGSEDQSGKGIFGQSFDNNGHRVGNEFQVNTFSDNNQQIARSMNINGEIIVAWGSFGQDGNENGIFAQKLTEAGEKKGDEFQVQKSSE